MFTIIKERTRKEETYYTYDFDRGDGSGYTFPCDKNGNVDKNLIHKEAYENFLRCKSKENEFEWAGVKKHKDSYIEPAYGRCDCGEEFELINQYMGACECPKCGQWYNIWGQALVNPKYWEEE